ncbi:hypothetical protein N7457_002429 [Penicillium paradoxum]|uniref:uncharacterized protein n=1 Tax=Penicillium paradoxum TaxID=176176 RepID=UPI002546E837|nr:uncharacterized protein N7457_002429 [Penicillium paradoxum]KAJ5787439.1 hypothetical protein N7457_002429 [Penicillium paradoxum]
MKSASIEVAKSGANVPMEKSRGLLGAGMGTTTGSRRTGNPIIRLAAAAKRAGRERIKERWIKQWDRDRTGFQLSYTQA